MDYLLIVCDTFPIELVDKMLSLHEYDNEAIREKIEELNESYVLDELKELNVLHTLYPSRSKLPGALKAYLTVI